MKQLELFAIKKSVPDESEPDKSEPDMHPIASATWKLYVDGAARNNPGPAGIGIYIEKNSTSFKKEGFFIGSKTNNQAEYAALLVGLLLLKEYVQSVDALMIFSDSKLMVQQILGNYRVKQPELQKLHAQVLPFLRHIQYTIHHIPRELNSVADDLANQGIDKKNKLPVIVEKTITL